MFFLLLKNIFLTNLFKTPANFQQNCHTKIFIVTILLMSSSSQYKVARGTSLKSAFISVFKSSEILSQLFKYLSHPSNHLSLQIKIQRQVLQLLHIMLNPVAKFLITVIRQHLTPILFPHQLSLLQKLPRKAHVHHSQPFLKLT